MILTINNLSYNYKETKALKNISFSLASGDFMTIVGPNGSGKSTLLKCLDRILKYKEGNIEIDGENLKNISLKSLSRKIAYVPQKEETVTSNTVFDIVMLGRKPYIEWNITEHDIKIVSDLLERFDLTALDRKSVV